MVDTLNELIERTTIEFPQSITGGQLKIMIGELAASKGYDIRGNFSVYFNARPASEEEYDQTLAGEKQFVEEDYLAAFNATIISYRHNFKIAHSFEAIRDISGEELEGFSGVKFNTIPGYGLKEISIEELKLMDAFREDIAWYFSEIFPLTKALDSE